MQGRSALTRKMQAQLSWSLQFSGKMDIELISNQCLSNYKYNVNTLQGMIQLYSKGIGPCLGVGVIRRGFSEEVAFNGSEYRKEMRRLHAKVHKINDLPLAP